MSYPKLKSPFQPAAPVLRVCTAAEAWQPVPIHTGESIRWESLDLRWVVVTIGSGAELGRAVVSSSDGRREVVESYEDALALAKRWRD